MPVFTIETTHRLPVFRQRSYEAETIAEACRLAIEDDDWSHEKHDYESAGETYVTGVWQGRDVAYRGPALPVPSSSRDAAAPGRALRGLLGLVQVLSGDVKPSDRVFWRDRAQSAIAKAQAILAGAQDPD